MAMKKRTARAVLFLWLFLVGIFYVSKPFRIACLLQQAITYVERGSFEALNLFSPYAII